jgi:hypothetical protein
LIHKTNQYQRRRAEEALAHAAEALLGLLHDRLLAVLEAGRRQLPLHEAPQARQLRARLLVVLQLVVERVQGVEERIQRGLHPRLAEPHGVVL